MHNIIKTFLETNDFLAFKTAINDVSYTELGILTKEIADAPILNERFYLAQTVICFKGYTDLVNKIINISNSPNSDFKNNTEIISNFIDTIDYNVFLQIVKHIGTIPEAIEHDSTAEKLYSKASDIVLARCFREMGLRSRALEARGDSADIVADSICEYGYSLVADAKCFRLSRTAKNQKDFKINNLAMWRGSENDYAVLVAPYYQYPSTKSQIYSDSLDKEVCILSWEHIYTLLKYCIKETVESSIENIFKITQAIGRDKKLAYSSRNQCFLDKVNQLIAKRLSISVDTLEQELNIFKNVIVERGGKEIHFWQREIKRYESYTREDAIKELIKSKKLNEKITVIKKFIDNLQGKKE